MNDLLELKNVNHTLYSVKPKYCSIISKQPTTDTHISHRLAMAESILFDKPLPLNGEGTISVNVKTSEPFAIRIQPYYPTNYPEDKTGYVEVRIHSNEARFWGRKPDAETKDGEPLGEGNPAGALEPERKVSYWFSFNRNGRFLKYGKGYIMEETTHLNHPFEPPKEKPEDDEWWFIFRPDTPKQVVIHTLLTPALYASKSLVDMEKLVGFYPYPLTKNWPPLVIDSSKSTLDNLAGNHFTQSASLPEACRELYENVAAGDVSLDVPDTEPKLTDAIKYSINTEGKILYNKLKEKGDMEYLRVTVGHDRGASPGVPYVLEIWPKDSHSPIHNHGNAYAVIKVLYGEINITVYNKTWKDASTQEELKSFVAKKGDVTWLSPNWYQTHKLSNLSSEFCATIQCYKYGPEDYLNWPYFDYLDGKEEGVHEFYPDSDFDFLEMRKDLLLEYRKDHVQQKVNP